MNNRECEHCKPVVIYESERFKLEMTKRGKIWELYGDTTHYQAVEEYNKAKLEGHEANQPGRLPSSDDRG